MKRNLRLAIAQINCTVGDFEGNCRKIGDYISKAKHLGCDIVSFPELAITGYPPEDLLIKNKFIDDNLEVLKKVAKSVNDIVAVVGFVDRDKEGMYNAAAVIYKGEVKGVFRKVLLPNYGVFDEARYFKSGGEPSPIFRFGDTFFAVNICEDIWHQEGPTATQASSGAKLIININSSPYHAGKIKQREQVVRAQAKLNSVMISYTNLVGGQDELVFDGQSMIVDTNGKVLCRADAFKEDILVTDIEVPTGEAGQVKDAILIADKITSKNKPAVPRRDSKPLDLTDEIYKALVVGLKDYVYKNGFKKVAIGLSGGIDSCLVAALAVDALGKENVNGIFMPSRYSSHESERDASSLAAKAGIKFITISIEQILKIYLLTLEPHFAGHAKDATEENLQARIRGNILMAFSNKFGWLILTTGNKSEMSTGYATLYGDMAGGFAVIKDVPKTLVYKLCKYRNSIQKIIPDPVFTKAPSAELKPDQKDSDTLPSYEILDPILKAYVEEDKGLSEIIAMGFTKDMVSRTVDMVDRSEYKRRQSPPGIKITPKAFGRDRRMPITNKYK